uniref:Uncharacterized protein n=1 Tax=Romanomermis culicivorax TaxID=13658 RepID=A0A915KYE4_ROMCU
MCCIKSSSSTQRALNPVKEGGTNANFAEDHPVASHIADDLWGCPTALSPNYMYETSHPKILGISDPGPKKSTDFPDLKALTVAYGKCLFDAHCDDISQTQKIHYTSE